MTKVGDLDKANGVKDKTMKLNREKTGFLINLLVNDLVHSRNVSTILFNEGNDSALSRDDEREIMSPLVNLALKKVRLLEMVIAANPWFSVDDRGKEIIEFWLSTQEESGLVPCDDI